MNCAKCLQPIRLGKVAYFDKVYHNGCFSCEVCKRTLKGVGVQIKPTKEAMYHVKCYEDNKEMVCAKCGKLMLEGGVEYKGQGYHDECFVCVKCGKSLSGKAFHVEDGEFYDAECYRTLNSMQCDQCFEMIDGFDIKYITYLGKSIHYECFKCSECRKQLSCAEKFRDVKTTVKGRLVCLECSTSTQKKLAASRTINVPKVNLPVAGMYKKYNFNN